MAGFQKHRANLYSGSYASVRTPRQSRAYAASQRVIAGKSDDRRRTRHRVNVAFRKGGAFPFEKASDIGDSPKSRIVVRNDLLADDYTAGVGSAAVVCAARRLLTCDSQPKSYSGRHSTTEGAATGRTVFGLFKLSGQTTCQKPLSARSAILKVIHIIDTLTGVHGLVDRCRSMPASLESARQVLDVERVRITLGTDGSVDGDVSGNDREEIRDP